MDANMQASTALRVAQNSSTWEVHGHANAAQKDNIVLDLKLLTTSITDAPEHQLREPDSEGRMAIDVLVNLAAAPGPAGALAREALLGAYEELSLSGKLAGCHALQNSALHMCEQKIIKADEELSLTVAYLGGRAEPPPWGSNGPGRTDSINSYILGKLHAELENEGDILEPGRQLSGVEMQAALAQFDNLAVQPEPIPVAGSVPDSQQDLAQWLDAAAQQARSSNEPVICVVNRRTRSGHGQVATVAEPKAGQVKGHVLTPQAGNDGGPELALAVRASLDASSSYEAPAVTHMLPPCADADAGACILMALAAVNREPDDVQGLGAVIEKHIAQSSQSSSDMQQAAALLTRAQVLEATQASSQFDVHEPAVSPMVALKFDAHERQPTPGRPEAAVLATPVHAASIEAAANTPALATDIAGFKQMGKTLGLEVSPGAGTLKFRSMFEKIVLIRTETAALAATSDEDKRRAARTRLRTNPLNLAASELKSEINDYDKKLPLTLSVPMADPAASAAVQTIKSQDFVDRLLRSPQVFLEECYKLAAGMKNDSSAGQQSTKMALQDAAKNYLADRKASLKTIELAIKSLPDGQEKDALKRLSIDGLDGNLYQCVGDFARKVDANPEAAAAYLNALPPVSGAAWLKS